MTTITIEQAGKFDGQEVTIKGWLYNLRESGKLIFPIFRDGTGIIQGVCALKESPEAFEALKGLTQESSVIATGKIRAEQRAPGGFEMGVSEIQIVQKVPESTPFPIQLKEHGVDFLLDHRHLWMRTPRQAAILRIRAEAIRSAREYMDSQGYTLTDAPMFTPAACEGTDRRLPPRGPECAASVRQSAAYRLQAREPRDRSGSSPQTDVHRTRIRT